MKRFLKTSVLLLIASLALNIGCEKNKNPNCVSYGTGYIFSVKGPDSASINENVLFDVKLAVMNGCGQFERFEEEREGNQIYIKAIAKYAGCICTQDIPQRQTSYTFKSATPGMYFFTFRGYEWDTKDTLILE